MGVVNSRVCEIERKKNLGLEGRCWSLGYDQRMRYSTPHY